MEEDFYLWSAKLSGWYTEGGSYVSDRKKATLVSKSQMIKICRVHMNNGFNEFGLLPVSEDILATLKGN